MTTLRVPETCLYQYDPGSFVGLLQEPPSHGEAGSRTQDSCFKPRVLIAVPKVCSESGILQP